MSERGISVTISSVGIKTAYEHISLDQDQVPIVSGTHMKVVELVLDTRAYGWSPEELHFQHPHLSLGQIYSALAYYWDHQGELDENIARRLTFVNQLESFQPATRLQKRLKKAGLI